MRLDDKVSVVTGGGRGIGKAIALRLASEGASVIITQRTFDQARITAAEIGRSGGKARAVKLDATSYQEVNQAFRDILAEFGKVDILVNTAGGNQPCPFHQSKPETWDWVIAANLTSALNCTRAVINPMMERRRGRIISIASIAGVTGLTNLADYSAAKAGLIGFTAALAKEVGEYGVTVNCVSPSTTLSERIAGRMTAETKAQQAQKTALGRLGEPEDIANMVAFLASDESSFITGQNYLVCGGRSLGYK
ncbi:MAG: SDR family oxidoreductase [Chloroflexi bacterium]|nr:SDR family oxidoreductase [Chloroflexota bacterium]